LVISYDLYVQIPIRNIAIMKARVTIDELISDTVRAHGVELNIGRIFGSWEEDPGPTRMPGIEALRNWDRRLLKKYPPFYLPFCDLCCLCTMGKCDLSKGKRGACGIDMAAQQSRIVLLSATIGCATHTGHARHLLEHLIHRSGRDFRIDIGEFVTMEAPHTRLVTGIKPLTLGDLEDVVDYCEREITALLSSCHTGQEGNNIDFESKVFHAGMVDHVAMEACDIAQISAYGFPKADPDAGLIDIGTGCIDPKKPTILVIGHNVAPSVEITNFMRDQGQSDAIELCGICCTALDMTRYNEKAKIIGPLSHQTRFIRYGSADLIVIDEQCVRTDVLEEAGKVHAPVIATHAKNLQGLPDRTGDPADDIVKDLVSGAIPGAAILDPVKAGQVAVMVSLAMFPKRGKFRSIPDEATLAIAAKNCTACDSCRRVCPNDLPLPVAIEAAGKGNLRLLGELYESCIGCARCETEGVCPKGLMPHTMILGASRVRMEAERFRIRTGRGPIQDTEIRAVGGPIVMGEVPGVIGIVGCSNYPGSYRDIGFIAEEFLKRRYIVTTSGCAAMSLAMYTNDEGQGLYERYPGTFDAGGLVNCGSCVSNAHISGAAIKIASIFARRKINSNYEEIADYVHNRVGAVGIAWGAMSQKASAIAAGFWRLGIPVIVGPHGAKYRRMLLGRKDLKEPWDVLDARTGETVYAAPAPEHLFVVAETKEEATVLVPKLCMRPSDTTKGRSIKLNHYIDLHRKFFGTMPDDIDLFVRTRADIPVAMKDDVLRALHEAGWEEGDGQIPDPTLLPRLIRRGGKRD
jgi:anaerobic carbon-monoxide dehydrogenase, CODH/ACS complex subunit alpha